VGTKANVSKEATRFNDMLDSEEVEVVREREKGEEAPRTLCQLREGETRPASFEVGESSLYKVV
jgi:hypothetical protein